MSLIIKGAVYTGGERKRTNVRITNGVIDKIGEGDLGGADTIIELQSREILLPAGVDLLCGLRDWIAAPKETVEAATKGALAGGVTVVCDQSNIVPRLNTTERIRERVEFVGERAYVDYGVAGHPPFDLAEVDGYAEAGAYNIGLYSWNLRHWRYPRDLDDSNAIFKRYADIGLCGYVVVDEAAFQETPIAYEGESYAVAALLRRLDSGFRVRISVTQPSSVDMILDWKDRLPNVSIQVPHHALLMDTETGHTRIGSAARHFPPLRRAEEVAQMQEYAREGKIDIFVSWHAPHRMQDKYGADPIPGEFTPKGGFSAIDIAYPHMLTKLGIETTCRHYCEKPAKDLRLKKGLIAEGYDADLVIVEEDEGRVEENLALAGGFTGGVWKVEPMEFYSKGKVTPFVGERLKYRVLKTFLRGELAFDREAGAHYRRPVRPIECLA